METYRPEIWSRHLTLQSNIFHYIEKTIYLYGPKTKLINFYCTKDRIEQNWRDLMIWNQNVHTRHCKNL